MTQFKARFSRFARFGTLAGVASAGLVLADAAVAQAFRSETLGWHAQTEIKIEASSPETVRLLAGIMEIRATLQLGLLAKQDGKPAVHINDARTIVWPEYREGLMAVGMVDLDPLLQKLDAATDKVAITNVLMEVEGALMRGHEALKPTSADMLLALHATAEEVATATINQSGPTEARDYQTAWARIMAARSELDLLMRDRDPAIAKYASEAAMAFDDVIISLPDPDRGGPVEIDPALFNELVSRLKGLNEEA